MQAIRIAPSPLTHIGWGALEKLDDEIERFGNRMLVVADPVLKNIGLLDKLTSRLAKQDFHVDVYTDVIPEPLVETGEKLVQHARSGNYDLVIGIGGGSALDLAKLAAVFVKNEGEVKDYLNLSGTRKLADKGLPKILIPTTSGTGAEVTNISVLALQNTKDVITHDYLLADVAVVDPELTVTVPPRVTAATGADALTHAIEAFLSVNANSYSDGHALQAIKLIGASLKKAVANGSDREARTAMSYGSYLAGLSFFNAGVGAIHALAYPLGGQFHLAHGESNAVLIPYVLGYIRKTCSSRLALILPALTGQHHELPEEEASVKCIEVLATLMKDIGIPQTLGGYQIPPEAAKALAQDGIKQKRLLARCPMPLTEEQIFDIYSAAFAGTIRTA
ncbi:iron-containing alcohol dehydrogenase [Flavisolibacter ginsenosidimutans]|uniref:Iron-containing alcohol dehydrogenase n=1 Tax=Flavisolibacter ginsenosidimutans TaxID=661481 RepID=A0A5B8UCW4_9BACT|nr:iron-containing alcohol dehydrogenase [Flavisolibacter ginsenosidimutans]QEC54404.1 iron-containing alcohol dehydrogenase [Flavisolibacter ginsenosidimutans]